MVFKLLSAYVVVATVSFKRRQHQRSNRLHHIVILSTLLVFVRFSLFDGCTTIRLINQSTIWLYCLQTKNFVWWSTQLHPAQSDLPFQWTHSRWARRPDRNRSGSFVFTFANSVHTRRWSLNDQGIVAVLSMKVCESPVPSTWLTYYYTRSTLQLLLLLFWLSSLTSRAKMRKKIEEIISRQQ